MVYVITSNNFDDNTMSKENSNYQLCILKEVELSPMINLSLEYNLYYANDSGIDEIQEEYENEILNCNEVPYVKEVCNILLKDTIEFFNNYMHPDIEDEFTKELMIISAIPNNIGKQFVREVNKQLRSKSIPITVINIYEEFKVSSISDLTTILYNRLNTKYIYEEDPLAYAYAVYKALGVGDVE